MSVRKVCTHTASGESGSLIKTLLSEANSEEEGQDRQRSEHFPTFLIFLMRITNLSNGDQGRLNLSQYGVCAYSVRSSGTEFRKPNTQGVCFS